MNYTKLCQTFSFSGSSLLGLSLSNCKENLGRRALQWRLREMHPPGARTKIVFFCWRIFSPGPLLSLSILRISRVSFYLKVGSCYIYMRKKWIWVLLPLSWKLDICITIRPQQGLSPSMTFLNPVIIFLLSCIERCPV